MIDPSTQTLVSLFFDNADRLGDRPVLWRKEGGAFQPTSWRAAAAAVTRLANGLAALGVQPRDRVVLVGESRPEWPIADLAIMAAGAITVPAYVTNTEDDHRHILENSEAVAAIVTTQRLAARLLPAAARQPACRVVIAIEPWAGAAAGTGPRLLAWDEALALGQGSTPPHQGRPDDVACIIYTSGTGGVPKGVMLSHANILHNLKGAEEVLRVVGLDDEVFLSFLPLSHAYEHTVGQFLPIGLGAQIYYAESIDKVAANMLEVRPTIVTGVPRFYEMVQQRILHAARKAGGARQWLLEKTVALGRERHRNGGRLGLVDGALDALLDRLVRDKIRARFGGRLKALVSGGAPLNPEVGLFYRALGLPLFQGYGQTEAAPLISVGNPLKPRLDSVGPPIAGVEVKIAGDGEILVRGGVVMKGYWRNEEATRAAIQDGWLHTGDIGEIDSDGNIVITDRKKDLIVNSGGDNIAPSRIETLLTQRPEIAQAMVYGDKRPHLVAILVPDAEWLRDWRKDNDIRGDLPELTENPQLRAALSRAIDAINRELPVIERVRRFAIAPQPFTIENGEMTPTLKIRRHVVREKYGALLEKLYE